MVIIHPTALVDPAAELGEDVTIGPFCIVEAGVRIGDRCSLGPHVFIRSNTTLGTDNTVDYGTVLGGDAQHRAAGGRTTFLQIGNHNVIREGVTMHRASIDGGFTLVGDDNLFMASTHLGHDVVVGNHTTLANLATIGGHVTIGDRATIGGMTAIHQRVSVGELAMVGGMSAVTSDVPPYSMCSGVPAKVLGINVVGLRRNDFDSDTRASIKRAIRLIFTSGRSRSLAIEEIERDMPERSPQLQALLDFVRATQTGHNGRQLEH
ncbi:MAG: acyl-ACP--UDP-N-acetylglucosamine O-acyltransferase [Armatimonadetes bacterium]|nr:acyl-ACP--UDP-N-acetylglucosamine O-acyltransferase [Armatimonadota bacterium]